MLTGTLILKGTEAGTSLRINRSKHQNASASSSRRIIIGEQRSLIPAQQKILETRTYNYRYETD